MDNPKVSVIIPVYNVEKFLNRCIDSLLAQSYPNLEFIFVDDGSSDRSFDILQNAARQDHRIRVYKQTNAGPSAARNAGIACSTGKYIMFCDSDDTVEPDWCETMVAAIREKPRGWIVCGINVLSETGELLHKYEHLTGTELTDISEYYTLFTEGLSGSVYNKIYDAGMVQTQNVCFDESLKRGEDVKFNLDYLKCCNSVWVLRQTCYNYYRYEQTQTLTNVYHEDDFHIQAMLYSVRKPYVTEKYLREFQTHYWHVLSRELDKTMETATISSLWKKLCLNRISIRTEAYKELLFRVGTAELPAWQTQLLMSERYEIYWILQKIYATKEKIMTVINWRRHE